MRRRLAGVAVLVVVAAVAIGVGSWLGRRPSREPAPAPSASVTAAPDAGSPRSPPAGEAELAILAPLRAGDTLARFTVVEIRAVNARGQLRLVCRKDRAEVRLDVALATDEGPSPPAVAGRYAIFYALDQALPAEAEALVAALAAVLTNNLATPTPPGMSAFVPRERRIPL